MNTDITRRDIIAAAAGIAAFPAVAASNLSTSKTAGKDAQDAPVTKPYDIIATPIKSDSNTVRFLFTYDCPFCRSYHNGLIQWGNTIPAPMRFAVTPVITSHSDNLVSAVFGRLLVQGLAPAKLNAYDYDMYAQIQGDSDTGQVGKVHISPNDVLRSVASATGLSGKQIADYINAKGKQIEKQIPLHAGYVQTYGLTATPAVAIGGRIVVNPDHSGGNPQQFLLLLNAMVSRAIQGGLNAL